MKNGPGYEDDNLSIYEALHRRDEEIDEFSNLLISDRFNSLMRIWGDYSITVTNIPEFSLGKHGLPRGIGGDHEVSEDSIISNLSLGLYRPNPNQAGEDDCSWHFAARFAVDGQYLRAEASSEGFSILDEKTDTPKVEQYQPIDVVNLLLAFLAANSQEYEKPNQYYGKEYSAQSIDKRLEDIINLLSDYAGDREIIQFCPHIDGIDQFLQIYRIDRGDQLSDQINYLRLARPIKDELVIDELCLYGDDEESDGLALTVKKYIVPYYFFGHFGASPNSLSNKTPLEEISPTQQSPKWTALVKNIRLTTEQAIRDKRRGQVLD